MSTRKIGSRQGEGGKTLESMREGTLGERGVRENKLRKEVEQTVVVTKEVPISATWVKRISFEGGGKRVEGEWGLPSK